MPQRLKRRSKTRMTVTIKEVGGDTLVRYKSSVKVSVYIWLVLSKYTVARGPVTRKGLLEANL